MPNRFASVLTCAAWLASSAALPQPVSAPAANDAPATPLPQVTVRALPTPKVIHELSQSFVQSYAAAPNPNINQIGRWRDPVCVLVLGLPLAEQAAKIKGRIESMAQALGLPAARSNCRPNVEIAFEDEPQHAMDSVSKRLEYLLGYYHLSRTERLKTVRYPVQAWYVTATKTSAAITIDLVGSGLPGTGLLQSSAIDDPEDRPPPGCANRSTACYSTAFHNVLIVADNKVLAGKPLNLVADDLVMLALSQPKSLDGCNALPSVIDRFAKSPCPGRDPPDGLTSADIAYLTALYLTDPEGKMTVAQFDIADRMAKILIKANAVTAANAGLTGSPSTASKAP